MNQCTNLRVQVVHPSDSIPDITALERLSDVHPVLDGVEVDWRVEPSLLAEFLRRGLVALDDEIVHDEPVQVTRRAVHDVSIKFTPTEACSDDAKNQIIHAILFDSSKRFREIPIDSCSS